MPLFSKGSFVVLESLSFTKTLYAFDFDGTLAKIVRDPQAARMTEVTENLMRQLTQLVPVAIVSGRSIDDLKSRVSFKPRFLIGNHGLEGLKGTDEALNSAQEVSRKWIHTLSNQNFESGVEVEDKSYSIAIHYRKSRNKHRARSQIKSVVEILRPKAHVILGKCVVNLIPPGAPHKGAALLRLIKLSEVQHAFYIGDDDTDEDIFSLPYDSGQIMSVRVGKKNSSSASYYIDRQSEINRVIKALIRFHQPVSNSLMLEGLR